MAVPEPVRRLAGVLAGAGGEAWVVGGAVRDSLLGRDPHGDWDLATDLLPERVVELFPRAHQFGIRFGTVVVVLEKVPYQITTFRRDGIYTDARRPDDVHFSRELEEDLIRRDFTINALAYDPLREVLADPVGGEADLSAGVIRAVGDAATRFHEDGLRLLRAVRFSAQLGFRLDPATFIALVRCAPRIEKIAAERIREELDKTLTAPGVASALDLMHECGLLRRILPELAACYGVPQNPHHAFDVFHHSLAAIAAAPPDNLAVRLAALCHDLGKPPTRREAGGTATFFGHQLVSARLTDGLMRRLRYPTDFRQHVAHLVHHHMFHYRPEWTDSAIRRFLREVGGENLEDLFSLRASDTLGNGLRKRLAPELGELRHRIDGEIAAQNALTVRDLAIGGRQIMDHLNIPPGPEVGRILDRLLQDVLEDPACNEPEILLERAAAYLGR